MELAPNQWEKTARRLQLTALVVFVFAGGVFFGTQYTLAAAQNGQIRLSPEVERQFEPLFEAYNLLDDDFIGPIDTAELVDGAIRGMVDAVDDTYTYYLDPESLMMTEENLSGEIQGIGAVISEDDEGQIYIVNVLKGTPAKASGLKEGDIFVSVNDEEIAGLTTGEVASRVRGPVGTIVDLTLMRDGELIEISVERAQIQVPNVEYEVLEGDFAYISMIQFSSNAREQVDEALDALDVNSLNGLIFDLRGNPGGLLSVATQIAGLFLDDGVILVEQFGDGSENVFEIRDGVVYESFDDGSEQLYTGNAGYAGVEVPVVVMVDERSASASELVAGAWQDKGVLTLVGTTSFGKGTVQIQNKLVNGAGLRLTVARWLTPAGNWISEVGVTPDIIVTIPEDVELDEDEDPQLEAALNYLKAEMRVELE